MKRLILVAAMATQSLLSAHSVAQNFFTNWQDRVRATSSKQPGWAVPVIAPHSGIVQLVRADFLHQYTSTHTTTWNYDNGKGVNLIPYYNTEIDINLPPYIQHNNPKVLDGAGDFSMVAKYRPFAGNESHGNYSVSFQLAASGATGSYKNGTASNTFTPTVVGGKGFGKFVVQSSIGGTLPTASVHTIGRTITWNTVGQYKLGKMFWPEVEVNSNFYHLGPNDGKNQTFVSPGLMVSKIKFSQESKSRLALVFGAGMQIATSSYHAYNHGLVMTSRLTF